MKTKKTMKKKLGLNKLSVANLDIMDSTRMNDINGGLETGLQCETFMISMAASCNVHLSLCAYKCASIPIEKCNTDPNDWCPPTTIRPTVTFD